MLGDVLQHHHHVAPVVEDGGWLVASSVFLAGLLGTIMPCTVQMGVVLATMLSQPDRWTPNTSAASPRDKTPGRVRTWLVRLGVFVGAYLLSFLVAAGLIGLVAVAAGQLVGTVAIGVVGGLALAAIGLQMLGWLRLPGGGACRGPVSFFLGRPYNASPPPGRLGASFAVYCAGCCGPSAVGAAVLLGQGTSFVAVAGFLLAYAAGMAIPFVLIAAGLAFAVRAVKAAVRWTPALTAVGGGVALLFGGLLIVRSVAGLF